MLLKITTKKTKKNKKKMLQCLWQNIFFLKMLKKLTLRSLSCTLMQFVWRAIFKKPIKKMETKSNTVAVECVLNYGLYYSAWVPSMAIQLQSNTTICCFFLLLFLVFIFFLKTQLNCVHQVVRIVSSKVARLI